MARQTPGPPVSPSPDDHPDAAGQDAASPAATGQPPAAVEASRGATTQAPQATAVEAPPEVVAPPAVAAAEGPPPTRAPGKPRKLLYATLPGSWGALIFGCLSFTPSLLPRGGIVQGVVFGITAAIGYGLGVWAASIWRAFADRAPRQPRR